MVNGYVYQTISKNAYLYGYMLEFEVNYGKDKSWKLIRNKGQYHNKGYVRPI